VDESLRLRCCHTHFMMLDILPRWWGHGWRSSRMWRNMHWLLDKLLGRRCGKLQRRRRHGLWHRVLMLHVDGLAILVIHWRRCRYGTRVLHNDVLRWSRRWCVLDKHCPRHHGLGFHLGFHLRQARCKSGGLGAAVNEHYHARNNKEETIQSAHISPGNMSNSQLQGRKTRNRRQHGKTSLRKL
jgi:hypothetical protein